jgi:hypothetical protein
LLLEVGAFRIEWEIEILTVTGEVLRQLLSGSSQNGVCGT